jgi:hypothetical protein
MLLASAFGPFSAHHEELSSTRLRFTQRSTKLRELPLPADKRTAACESPTLHFRGHDSDAGSERKQSSAQ